MELSHRGLAERDIRGSAIADNTHSFPLQLDVVPPFCRMPELAFEVSLPGISAGYRGVKNPPMAQNRTSAVVWLSLPVSNVLEGDVVLLPFFAPGSIMDLCVELGVGA